MMGVDGQALFDHFLSDMDQNLRTIGVGDVSVPKKMKKMGAAFYGRYDAYLSARRDRADARRRHGAQRAGRTGRGSDRPRPTRWPTISCALTDPAPATLTAAPQFPDPLAFAPRRAAEAVEVAS